MSLREELILYSEDIIKGKIISCKKHKWSCERFLRDIKKEENKTFDYYFDEERANDFLLLMNGFKHTKGVLAGLKIEPAIIHKFIFGNIYGWYNNNTGYRRFNKLYWQVSRKQGKSQWLSGVAAYECMLFNQNSVNEVYCAATKTDQAKIIWNETKLMLDKCEGMRGKYDVKYGKINHIKTGSFIRTLSEEDGKKGDGLNPQCATIDEYHAHDTSEIYDVLDSGMGARPEPLLAIITTAGFNLSNPCYRVEYDLCSKILNPDIDINIDSYFVMINELDKNDTPDDIEVNGKIIPPGELIDDINDEAVWEKSNPINCSYQVGIDYLRKKHNEAIVVPEKMTNFLTKHMDVWVNIRETGYMDVSKWASCGATKERLFPDVYKKKCIPGVDLSSIHDLTSTNFEVLLENEEFAILSHSFIASDVLEKKKSTDKVPYDLWVKQGWITSIPGPVVLHEVVLNYIIEQFKKYEWPIDELCYDRAMASWFASEVEKKGFRAVDVPQSYSGVSEPIKDLKAKIYLKKIYHDNNPVLGWAMSNAVIRKGPTENIMLDKDKSTNRIDPVSAAVNSHFRGMVLKNDHNNVYNRRGLREL